MWPKKFQEWETNITYFILVLQGQWEKKSVISDSTFNTHAWIELKQPNRICFSKSLNFNLQSIFLEKATSCLSCRTSNLLSIYLMISSPNDLPVMWIVAVIQHLQ